MKRYTQPRAVLRHAAEYMRKHGKQSGLPGGNYFGTKPDGPCCVLGAIASVATTSAAASNARNLLYRRLPRYTIGSWSDNHTAEYIINALLNAANGPT